VAQKSQLKKLAADAPLSIPKISFDEIRFKITGLIADGDDINSASLKTEDEFAQSVEIVICDQDTQDYELLKQLYQAARKQFADSGVNGVLSWISASLKTYETFSRPGHPVHSNGRPFGTLPVNLQKYDGFSAGIGLYVFPGALNLW
jgi:hypothetical protein